MITKTKKILILLLFISFGCKTNLNNKTQSEVKFGTDIISNETIALKYAELVFLNRYNNVNFEVTKPFEIRSIDNDKVWYVIAEDKREVIKKNSYHIKISKNDGKVIDIWRIH